MLCLYLQAPFAVFRTFAAGSFRPTAGFITPSAAYGLLLNVAGVEMRHDDGKQPMTLIRGGLPDVRIALGALELPRRQSIYQQLHNYPVGRSGKEHAPATKGNKYNIAPVRRAFLSDLRAYICLDGNDDLEQQVRDGLGGNGHREYGLPFLGDNNFLPDRLELIPQPEPAYWFEPLDPGGDEGIRDHVTRLTITINRQDISQTRSKLFAPTPVRTEEIPPSAWVEVSYS